MKLHLVIFSKIKEILQKHFGSDLNITQENGDTFLEIKNSDFWIKSNEFEFTVGFGTIHSHFSEEYENLDDVISKIISLITNEIKVTKFIKGNFICKVICEIIYDKSKIEIFGKSYIIFYPFWKKAKVEVIKFDRLIEKEKILPDFEILKNELEETEDQMLLKLMLEARNEVVATENEFLKALNKNSKK